MLVQIKHRFSSKVLFEIETPEDVPEDQRVKYALEKGFQAKLAGADLGDVNLSGANLSRSILRGCYLTGADLRGSNLSYASLVEADLRETNLSEANLRGANLSGADLSGADLRGTNLSGADLQGTNLSGADFRDADLSNADLRGSNLSRSSLGEANLSGAKIIGRKMSGANLRESNLTGITLFDNPEKPLQAATLAIAIENLDRVRDILMNDSNRLEMNSWHGGSHGWRDRTSAEETLCGTAHCLAGWLQVLSDDETIRELTPELAGLLLAPIAAKMFFKEPDEVLSWLENREYDPTAPQP